MRGLSERGHDILFLERDVPWYADNRDLRHPPYGNTELYSGVEELQDRFAGEIARADAVIVGSYVPQGVAIGQWVLRTARGVTAFYDIDTPVTMGKLARGDYEYLSPDLAGQYDLYLSFTGGPTLDRIRRLYGAARPRALYCSVDPDVYYPQVYEPEWDLGYLGTYSDDRQPALDRLLIEPARQMPGMRFVVAGPQYPSTIAWSENVQRIEHLPPAEHRQFYNSQRFTLNITRREMVLAGWSPSVRLFEAAACGVPILSDYWPGLETFFVPGKEVIVDDAAHALLHMDERARLAIGAGARDVVMARHTAANRAVELEGYVHSVNRHDKVFVNSARANGNGWAQARRANAGSASEPAGARAGGATGAAVEGNGNRGAICEPARTGHGNGSPAGAGSQAAGARVRSDDGTRLRGVDGTEHR